jgi:crotonobetainyl-CoA:carnitine CoA-transferase CaiB-like acyl-CoA transferase
MVLQAMSGMMLAQGGTEEPVANTIAIIDVTTAAMCVLCSVLGIYHREQTGEGQRAWDSLAATATYLQAGELVRYSGRVPMARGNTNYRGPSALDRFYAVSDGWVRVQAAQPGEVTAAKLARAGLEVDPQAYTKDPIAALTGVLQVLPGEDAVRRLANADIAATRARKVTEVLRDPQLLDNEFVHVRMSADNTPFVAPGRFATFSRTQRSGPMYVAGIGEHTVEVLGKAGMAAETITHAVETGALVAGGPMEQRLMPSYR